MELSDKIKSITSESANLAIELVECFNRVKTKAELNMEAIELEIKDLNAEEKRKMRIQIDEFFREKVGLENYEVLKNII